MLWRNTEQKHGLSGVSHNDTGRVISNMLFDGVNLTTVFSGLRLDPGNMSIAAKHFIKSNQKSKPWKLN